MLQNSSSFGGGVNLAASTSAAAPPRLEICFTCFRKTDSYLRIVETDGLKNYNPAAIFAQHFWFTRDEYYNQTICSNCWIAIDDFHHFYCQVEKHHPIAIKSEALEYESSEESEIDFDRLIDLNHNIFENGVGTECGTTTEQNRFKCDVCPESFTEEKLLHNHRLSHAHVAIVKEENHHHCVVCDQYFDTTRELRGHQRSDHVPSVVLAPDVVTTNSIVKEAEQCDTEQNDPAEFRCEFCPRVFSTLRELKHYHSWRHTKPNERKKEDVQPSLIETRSYRRTRGGNLVSINTALGTRRDQYLNKATTTVETNRSSNVRTEPKKRGRPPSTTPVEENVLQHKQRWKQSTDKEISEQERVILKYTDFKCSKCSYVASTFIDLQKHGVKKHNFKPGCAPAQCCGRRYFNRLKLYNHCLTHINPTLTSNVQTDPKQSRTPVNTTPGKDNLLKYKQASTQRDFAEQQKLIREVTGFKCTNCPYVAETFRDLKKHGVKKHNISTANAVAVRCCGKRYYTTITLYYHCLIHIDPNRCHNQITGPKKRKTPAAKEHLLNKQYKQSTESEIVQQEKLILKFTDFRCLRCPYKAETFLGLRKHGEKKHNISRKCVPVQCCGRRYYNRLPLYYHCLTHIDPNRFKCDMCGKVFDNIKQLRRHQIYANRPSNVGTDPKNRGAPGIENLLLQNKSQCGIAQQEKLILKYTDFRCSECPHVAKTFLDLRAHGEKKHNVTQKSVSVQCCGKNYNTRLMLYYHCLTHIDPNCFKCNICGKVFKDIEQLRYHSQRAEVQDRPVKCYYCGASFVQLCKLKQHLETLHGR